MPAGAVRQIDFFFGQDMSDSALRSVASGTAAIHSARSPDREGANEDAAALILCDATRAVLAVADGFGGRPAGDQAAQLALTVLSDAVRHALAAEAELREGILNGFEQANHAVDALGVGAATTLAVVEIGNGYIRPYHVGDSQILVVGQRGKLKLQTVPHSPVGYAVEAGWLEQTDAMHHEERHLVSNMVGSAEMRIEVGPVLPLRPRDTLLIASDGLFDNLHLDEIVDSVRKGRLATAAATLSGRCGARMRQSQEGLPSKPDDLTFILFRLS